MKITMNTLDGVTLKTKNKYVNEDIAVAVSDEAINEKLTEITIDKDGTYEPTEDNIGFSKVIVDTNKPKQVAQITIPEQGNWAQGFGITTFDIDVEWALLSEGSGRNGLWLCNKLTGEDTQLLDSGTFYSFVKIDDRIITVGNLSTSSGLHVYHHNTKTIDKNKYGYGRVYGTISNACRINNAIIFTCKGLLLRYDYEQNTFNEIRINDVSFASIDIFYSYGNKIIFKCDSYDVGYGFYIYDEDTQTVRLLLDTKGGIVIQAGILNNGYFASYKDVDNISYHIAKFDEEKEEFVSTETPDKLTISSTYCLENENGTLFWSGSSSVKGVWWYSTIDNTFERVVFNDNYQYATNKCAVLEDYMFLSGSSTSACPGWVLFNTLDKTVINTVTEGVSYNSLRVGKYIFIASTSSTYKSLYLYNTESKEIPKTLDFTSNWINNTFYGVVIKDRILLSCNAVFYMNDETVKTFSFGAIRNSVVGEDYAYCTAAYLGTSSVTQGSLSCYSYADDKIYTISSSKYDILKLKEGICYASSTDPTSPETLKFNTDSKSWWYSSIYKGEI